MVGMNKNIFRNADGNTIEFTRDEAMYAIKNLPFFDETLMVDDDLANAIHIIKIITNVNGCELGYPIVNITNPIYLAIGVAAINKCDNVQRTLKETIDLWDENINAVKYDVPEDYEIAKVLREYFDVKGKFLDVPEDFDEIKVKKYIIGKYKINKTPNNTVAEILNEIYDEYNQRIINTIYNLMDDVIGELECNALIMLYNENKLYKG